MSKSRVYAISEILFSQDLVYARGSFVARWSGSKRNNLKMRRPDGRAKSERSSSSYDRPVVRKGGSTFEDNSEEDGEREKERRKGKEREESKISVRPVSADQEKDVTVSPDRDR